MGRKGSPFCGGGFAGELGCKRSPDDVGGIWGDESGGVDVKGDETTVVNDWADMSAGETRDEIGERAGAELGGWGPL